MDDNPVLRAARRYAVARWKMRVYLEWHKKKNVEKGSSIGAGPSDSYHENKNTLGFPPKHER